MQDTKIPSFQVNHEKLMPGVYLSRQDNMGDKVISTFDLRMTMPNREPVINIAEFHSMEHIGATYFRLHSPIKERVIYFGPMGCRTGYYWLVEGINTSKEALLYIISVFEHIAEFEGKIPGCDPKECGNYLDHNLPMSHYEAKKYLKWLYNATDENLIYPA